VTQNPAAAGQLRQAISRLESDNHGESRRWARWLTKGEAPDPAVAAHACLDLEHHFVYMAALAQRFPEHAEEYLMRAATMRSKESFYSLALADLFTR
jgi:hypothetical protein